MQIISTATARPKSRRHLTLRPKLSRLALASALTLGSLTFGMQAANAVTLDPTPENVAAAIAGGQKYLYDLFTPVGETTGYWNSGGNYSNNLTDTAAAVAALIESGKMSDPLYKAQIEKGVKYIIANYVQPDGGIYDEYESYQTGMALVALGLYGQNVTLTGTDKTAFDTVVRNAVNFLKSFQHIEGSTHGGDYGPNGEATATNPSACGASYKPYYGGWGYYNSSLNTGNKCRGGADLSNTQFVVMGLYYASRYLGDPIASAPWAQALLYFVKNQQNADGGFSVYATPYSSELTGMSSALWALTMIGQTDAKKNPGDTKTIVQNAIDWYNLNYSWQYDSSPMYFVYGMSKALTGTIGTGTKVGTNDWVADMETWLLNKYRTTADGKDSWYTGAGLDPDRASQTSWALMSLAFASTNVESTEKFLAQTAELDNTVQGTIVLHTTGGVTISQADRGRVDEANLGQNVALPIGSVSFTLNNVPVGGTTVLSITPPDGALDPTNANSFVNADGTIKSGLSWFKIDGGAWKGLSSVPITIDKARNVIEVTLKDGGPEDADGAANGKIVDPGAPGYGAAASSDDDGGDGGFFGCSIGNGKFDPTLPLLAAGSLAYLLRRRRN